MSDIILADNWDSCSVESVLAENQRRLEAINAPFNPFTGEFSVGKRSLVEIDGFPIPKMWLPDTMLGNEFTDALVKEGLDGFIFNSFPSLRTDKSNMRAAKNIILDHFDRMRNRYDFPYWCWMRVPISQKGGGADIRFRLNLAQRKLMTLWDEMEQASLPVRIIMLKARQWGGSTCTQVKFAHIQLVVTVGANSIIVGHVKDASTEVKDMYFKLINRYPKELLYAPGSEYNSKLPNIHGTSSSANLFYIDSRSCKLKLGSAERPESARGGDSTLSHCTEVAMWVATEGKEPEDIVRSVTGGIAYTPGTVIMYESTANGTDNMFHDEYMAAKEAWEHGLQHQFRHLFISWFDIGWKNMLPFRDNEKFLKCNSPFAKRSPCFDPYLPETIPARALTEREFAEQLIANRHQQNSDSDRQEPGSYLWWLWKKGATLQAIYWYMVERTKFHNHADMASEAPSDDVEAFRHSGQVVFSDYYIAQFESGCRPPKMIGEIESTLIVSAEEWKRYRHRANDAFNGKRLLSNLEFRADPTGNLWVWELPEKYEDCRITDRYLTVVDIGGMSNRSDYSVIVVFDRYWMMEGGRPSVVAQWYGHCDHDILAWKSAQIARYYDNSLLVIESNTLETRDRDRDVDGDQSGFILNQIKESYTNLYERTNDEDSILETVSRKYGWHTNARTKPLIVSNMKKMVRDHAYIERDKRCLDELRVYERKPNGSWGSPKGKHDDLAMTRMIAMWINYNEMNPPRCIYTNRKAIPQGKKQINTIII